MGRTLTIELTGVRSAKAPGQSIKKTLEELGASEEIMKRYLDQKSGDMNRK